jgi:diacylglycerol kinase (ATP)
MPKTGLLGLLYRRTISAAENSFKGLKDSFVYEEAFRVEVFLCLILIPMAFYVAVDYLQLILLILSVLLVMIVELLNTGIEIVVDRIGLEFNELSGRAKDVGSAAVFLSMVVFAVVWGTILVHNYDLI